MQKPDNIYNFSLRPAGVGSYDVTWGNAGHIYSAHVVIPARFIADVALKAIKNRSGKSQQTVTQGQMWPNAAITAEVIKR